MSSSHMVFNVKQLKKCWSHSAMCEASGKNYQHCFTHETSSRTESVVSCHYNFILNETIVWLAALLYCHLKCFHLQRFPYRKIKQKKNSKTKWKNIILQFPQHQTNQLHVQCASTSIWRLIDIPRVFTIQEWTSYTIYNNNNQNTIWKVFNQKCCWFTSMLLNVRT